jgi:hypothetical protein
MRGSVGVSGARQMSLPLRDVRTTHHPDHCFGREQSEGASDLFDAERVHLSSISCLCSLFFDLWGSGLSSTVKPVSALPMCLDAARAGCKFTLNRLDEHAKYRETARVPRVQVRAVLWEFGDEVLPEPCYWQALLMCVRCPRTSDRSYFNPVSLVVWERWSGWIVDTGAGLRFGTEESQADELALGVPVH